MASIGAVVVLLVLGVFIALVVMGTAAGLFLGLCDWLRERY